MATTIFAKSVLLACAICPLSMAAQSVAVNPTPQHVEWVDSPSFPRPAAVSIVGSEDADADALAAMLSLLPQDSSGIRVVMGEKGDASVEPYLDLIPDFDGGYFLSVDAERIVIAGNNGKGTFYGVQTLKQLLAAETMEPVAITDWPATANRGVIEGFYGNPWSFTDRCRQFEFYGANKLDTYVYGPKDDPYHHGRWREPYPEDKAEEMRQMAKKASENKVWFVWAMHPGNSITSSEDRSAALAKFEQMYEMGFRSFAIFFDDISGYNASDQADYLNFLTDNFVHKHTDVTPLMMCPSQYNRSWAGDGSYLRTLASGLYDEVNVMWTGNSVVDMINVSDVEWFRSQLGRDPFIWLNYPVNDYGQHNMLMGPFYGNDIEAPSMCRGFCSNPMEYAEASKVALYSMADFVWNPEAYDCDKAWLRSMEALMPGHGEAFRIFCSHNVDLAPNTHGLRLWGESPEFKAVLDKHPVLDAESAPQFAAQFEAMTAAAEELKKVADQPEMTAELLPWYEYMSMQGRRGSLLVEMYSALAAKDADDFCRSYAEYKALVKASEDLLSRPESSIRSVAPRTATLYVEPFITQTVGKLISDFKDAGLEAPSDLFPSQVVENGVYFIRHQGRYLTNADAGSVGGYPVFMEGLDVINPDRQAWRIRLDPSTGRYSIFNVQDERYLNEKGEFTVNDETNPFEQAWHTYNFYRHNTDYAIQNGGSAKSDFWSVDGDRIVKGSGDSLGYHRMVFALEPYAGATKLPVIVDGRKYFIIDPQGRYLTNTQPGGTGGVPLFQEKSGRPKASQQWTFTLDEEHGRVDLRSASDNRYVNEKGEFGTNQYYADWNTYEFFAKGDSYAIRNGGSAGKGYWAISGDRIVKAGEGWGDMQYLFRIVDVDEASSSVGLPVADASEIVGREFYDIAGRRLPDAPENGVAIVRIVRADGSSSSSVVMF